MLYLFTWNNRFLIQKEAQRWKKNFQEKFGLENVIHITTLENTSLDFLRENFLSQSIFSPKRLVIIDGFPYSWARNFAWATDLEAGILSILEKIPEEILVVFLSIDPDKRTSAYKTISKLAEVKVFTLETPEQAVSQLARTYRGKIDSQALQLLVYYKWWNILKSTSEIDKLLLTHQKIDAKLVEYIIIPEFEESIFVFIDTLLQKNNKKIFLELENLLTFSNFYEVYQSIIANIRVFLYIELLKSKGISPQRIWSQLKLWNRQFLIQKNHNSKISEIETLYISLLNLDKNMKFGKLMSSDERDLHRELENVFLKYCL